MPIPIIDLFAGPGGLGEGFMSLKDNEGKSVFDIKLSIEKDKNAHKTLTWRSFYRQFDSKGKKVPNEYYEAYTKSDLIERERIIEHAFNKYPEGKHARFEAQLVELGSPDWPSEKVDSLIEERLDTSKDWVLIGGPPCQAYSNVGRSRVGGIAKEDHRVYLYQEYLRIIDKYNPAIFVMENVKGLLSAKVGGEKVFDWIKNDLKLGGRYSIHSFVKPVESDKDFLIKAEKFGVPQKRHRVILLGVRNDINYSPQFLNERQAISLKSIIDQLPKVRSAINRSFYGYHQNEFYRNGKPKRVYKTELDSNHNWIKLMHKNVGRIKKWGELPINGFKGETEILSLDIGSEYVPGPKTLIAKHPLKDWYQDRRLKGVSNHQSRAHLTQDLMRYLFASLYLQKHGTFPRLEDFARHHDDLIPDHENVSSGKFTDRFRVQVPDIPATTVTSHISKDGHYFIHYDPKQCRSLTVREAARIQTFPDNYLFRGSRTQQFHQVGNAVPPYLAFQIAKIVKNLIH